MLIAKLQFIVAKLQKIVFLDRILGNTYTKHYRKAPEHCAQGAVIFNCKP
jgi:hypothetical protein